MDEYEQSQTRVFREHMERFVATERAKLCVLRCPRISLPGARGDANGAKPNMQTGVVVQTAWLWKRRQTSMLTVWCQVCINGALDVLRRATERGTDLNSN